LLSIRSREQARPEPRTTGSPRIFVRIAAYRDPECEWTLKDLFEKAAEPERIFAAVCWQYSPHEDPSSVRIHAFREQVRTVPVPAALSRGVCWARHSLERLWRGEEYTLQIDSHSRFIAGWDRALLEELAACPSEKPVLSCNPAPYLPPHELSAHARPTIRVAQAFASGSLRFHAHSLDRAPERPLNGAFVAAGFVFSSSKILEEVPYDPELYFNQEEAAYSLRLYTHGWDVFSPSRNVLYHYYNVQSDDAKSLRPLHWQDNLDWRTYDARARARFDVLTGARNVPSDSDLRLGPYGVGAARSVADFEAYSGVDFERKSISERARRGLFVPDLHRYKESLTSGELEADSETEQLWHPPSDPALRLGEHDFLPFFTLLDQHGRRCEIQGRGGLWTLMVLVSDLDEPVRQELLQCLRHLKSHAELELVVVVGQAADTLRAFDSQARLWCDADRRVSTLLGAATGRAQRPLVLLVGPNLRIERVFRDKPVVQLACAACSVFGLLRRSRQLRVVSAQAPVLLIPHVLSRVDCRKLVEYFQSHPREDGKVGAAPSVYRPSNKIRTDCFVRDTAEEFIDEHLARRVLPEIEKVYGLCVTHREGYKIGCYESSQNGFFSRHRDSLDPTLAYRRYAVLLNLNDDFSGGELCFPEYGNVAYKPPTGHAIVFACSLVHEAQRVTKGRRYILQGFLFGEREAAYRARIEGDSSSMERSKIRAPRVTLGLASSDVDTTP